MLLVILLPVLGVLKTEAFFIAGVQDKIRKNDAHCRQNHGSSSLVCPATDECFNPDKKTCCTSGYLADVPSLHGVCCGTEVFNTQKTQMKELTCRTPKQNYAFCNKRSPSGDPCKHAYANIIVIRHQIETNGFNIIYNGTIRPRSWITLNGTRFYPGNQKVIRIITDRWMPCHNRLTGDNRFLIFSNVSFEKFIRGNFYHNPNDIIIPIQRRSKKLISLQKRCNRQRTLEKTLN
ncbi:hypothetical protein ACJMK2_036418 [Sinanodonta woodiana]|uniref:Uncharacterized protein n=1 Tax=Sinanodonta woodiana TaxID=1069815 RepID=A0ABD3WHH5_SINWO